MPVVQCGTIDPLAFTPYDLLSFIPYDPLAFTPCPHTSYTSNWPLPHTPSPWSRTIYDESQNTPPLSGAFQRGVQYGTLDPLAFTLIPLIPVTDHFHTLPVHNHSHYITSINVKTLTPFAVSGPE